MKKLLFLSALVVYGYVFGQNNLFEKKLDPLDAGYYYYYISKSGWCTYPPSVSYSITIALLEYISYDYQIVDYVTMNGYTNF